MNETIQTKLALQIAQLSLDKVTFEARCEELQAQVNQLTAELDQATQPGEGGEE